MNPFFISLSVQSTRNFRRVLPTEMPLLACILNWGSLRRLQWYTERVVGADARLKKWDKLLTLRPGHLPRGTTNVNKTISNLPTARATMSAFVPGMTAAGNA